MVSKSLRFVAFMLASRFFSCNVSTRMIICLLVHPLVVELSEVINRNDLAAKYMNQSKDMTLVKEKCIQDCQPAFGSKLFKIASTEAASFPLYSLLLLLNLWNRSLPRQNSHPRKVSLYSPGPKFLFCFFGTGVNFRLGNGSSLIMSMQACGV